MTSANGKSWKHLLTLIATTIIIGLSTAVAAVLTGELPGALLVSATFSFLLALLTHASESRKNPLTSSFIILTSYYFSAFYLTLTLPHYFEIETSSLRISLALLKSILICAAMSIGISHHIKRQGLPPTPIVLLTFSILISTMLPVEQAGVKLQYLANTYIPLILSTAALQYHLSSKKITEPSVKNYQGLAIAVLLSIPLGYLISFQLIPTEFFSEHQGNKGFSLYNGLPLTWWTVLGDHVIARFPGTSDDPILFGYISSALCIVFLSGRKYLLAALFSFAAIISLSKGALIWLIATSLMAGMTTKIKQRNYIYIVGSIVLVAGYLSFASAANTSANVHIVGLVSPIVSAITSFGPSSLIGNGVGSSGNLLKIFLMGDLDTDSWLAGGAESGIGLLVYQIGFIGTGAFILAAFRIFGMLSSPFAKCAWIIYWVNASMQENLINLNYIIIISFTVYACESAYNAKKTAIQKN
jgi:hypothetical protein|tara:strand:+ start:4985 stop:6397 length:1413 start_codon:yes stop_codon:yes gene_type:complete